MKYFSAVYGFVVFFCGVWLRDIFLRCMASCYFSAVCNFVVLTYKTEVCKTKHGHGTFRFKFGASFFSVTDLGAELNAAPY